VSFKAGDLVVVIAVPGASYPSDALPGTVARIVEKCGCLFTMLHPHPYWLIDVPSRRLCAAEPTLRKIDGEDRQVVRWDTVPWQPERERTPA
jgi:hypothetical protein